MAKSSYLTINTPTAGVTFLQLANWLHERGASIGYTLVNWNITLAGSVAMGAHRSSLREDSMVAAGAQEIHIIDGKGELRVVARNETNDEWLAASVRDINSHFCHFKMC